MSVLEVNHNPVLISSLEQVFLGKVKLKLSDEAINRIVHCRTYLEDKIRDEHQPIYGINTGFGSLCNTEISKEDLSKLQENLVMSHACGMGEQVPEEIVSLMLYFKIHALALGYSGVKLDTVQLLVEFYNHRILPVVFQQGSLGASGDLAPLAHLALPLMGKGKVRFQGKEVDAKTAMDACGLKPVELGAKEGLALLNGTQFMSAYAAYLVFQAHNMVFKINKVAAMSLDAYDGRIEPFTEAVHAIRPHRGQLAIAQSFREILEGSTLINRNKTHVQDPYSFRCIPQVHGASLDTIHYVQSVVETEINSVTDNPTVFPDEDLIVSAGNFHGQPLALVLDFLCIALAELGSISERRIFKLVSGTRGLPPFLASNPGLNSGFMIPQYTAASIASQNKQLCTPASIDTIDSSNGQEDHVSMGANAATKCFRVLQNVEKIASIELLCAAQALEYRRPETSSEQVENMLQEYREKVPFIEKDLVMHDLIQDSLQFFRAV
jgi:histidine ammonia-lyase